MSPFVFGSSPAMRELEGKVNSIAASQLPVLIEGESGTGKATLAEYMHLLDGAKGEFVRFHCGRGDAELLAERLFRDCESDGNLQRSLPGTLFLANVSALSHTVQQRLLAAMQGGLGGDPTGNGCGRSVRLMCSASDSLEHWVARGQFLPDLYFRLTVCRLTMPPLRERPEDVPELFLEMIERARCVGLPSVPPPSPRLLDTLTNYPWPGNLRELRNFARSYVVSPDQDQMIAELVRRFRTLNLSGEHPELPLRDQVRRASKQLESEIILRALERHRWNRRRAAQTLKISYRALLYKMKDCKLRTESEGPTDGV